MVLILRQSEYPNKVHFKIVDISYEFSFHLSWTLFYRIYNLLKLKSDSISLYSISEYSSNDRGDPNDRGKYTYGLCIPEIHGCLTVFLTDQQLEKYYLNQLDEIKSGHVILDDIEIIPTNKSGLHCLSLIGQDLNMVLYLKEFVIHISIDYIYDYFDDFTHII